MSPRRPSNRDLDELIEEITVDCYDHDEQLGGFETAFDADGPFPFSGTVIGQEIEVLSVVATAHEMTRSHRFALTKRRHLPVDTGEPRVTNRPSVSPS